MYDEYNTLVKNGTWLLVPRPTCVNMVRSMWLLKHKFHADGTLSRYKACLVASGSSQQLGVHFDETFSLVVKPATVRMVLSLAVSQIFIWTETSTPYIVLAVCRPTGVNMVRSMWLLKHKFHADGTLSRYKACLVASGSSQQL
nr:ribonuclease H-like domain-containing protein [Tanacetum cinerariifolium]